MPEQIPKQTQRRAVLLATDLSARCDRALDRATLLAQEWNTGLIAVHALEQSQSFYDNELERRLPSWRRSHDAKQIVESQIQRDVMGIVAPFGVVVERSDPAELIARVAAAYKCDVIVTGIARDETLGRFGLGNTVDRLLRRSNPPVLITKGRVRSPYRNILVATDLSQASSSALETVLSLFPDDRLTVFHAYHIPFSGMADNPDRLAEQYGRAADAECEAFLQSIEMNEGRRQRMDRIVEHGNPVELIAQYVQDKGVDLVALGTHGRSRLVRMVLGSTARDILWSLSCDALVVPAARGAFSSEVGE
jgi:nucleotide-binding universal stress UspA family protein